MKRSVLLLLISPLLSTSDEFNGLVKAEGNTNAELARFGLSTGHHTEEVEEQNEEENNEEDEEEEQNKKSKKSKNTKTKRLNGRDENGMYKNHQSYVALRNKINEEENDHLQMFENINNKLNDPSFVQSAVESTSTVKLGSETGRPGSGSKSEKTEEEKDEEKANPCSTSTNEEGCDESQEKIRAAVSNKDRTRKPRDSYYQHYLQQIGKSSMMTKEEKACYSARYSDLNGMDPFDHYLEVGKKQGRNPRCGKVLTWFMAERYLDRYWYLGDAYGRSGRSAMMGAKLHWSRNGSRQNPPLDVEPRIKWHKLLQCGDYKQQRGNTKYKSWCDGCKGRFMMGLRKRPDTGARIGKEDGDEFNNWQRLIKHHDGSKVFCDVNTFNSGQSKAAFVDEFQDQDYWCFCELDPKQDWYDGYEPYHCSADGGDCKCRNGHLLYGPKLNKDDKMAAKKDLLAGPFTGIKTTNADVAHSCSPKTFDGVDPAPGIEKECYCDDERKINWSVIQTQIDFWSAQYEERRAREAAARAAAEAAAARARAKAEAARRAADEEAARKRRAAADAANKAAAECRRQVEAAETKAADEARAEAAKAAAATAAQTAADAKAAKEAYEAKVKAAAAKAAAAERARGDEERRKATDEAEQAQQEAIKAQVSAALARQAEEHATRIKTLKETQSKKSYDDWLKERQQDRLDEAAATKREQEADAAHDAELRAKEEAHDKELAAQAEAHAAALQKGIAAARERQRAMFEAQYQAAEKLRLKWLEEEKAKMARMLAMEREQIEQLEERKKAAWAEKEASRAEAQRAEDALRAREKAEHEEKLRLEKEEHATQMQEMKARDALLQAQRDEELAKTQAEVDAAQEAARNAQKALEDTHEERRAVLRQKKQLQEEVKTQQIKAQLAKERRDAAEQAAKDAEDDAKASQEEAEKVKKAAAADMAAAEQEQKEHEAMLAKKKADMQKKHDEAIVAQKEQYKKATEAAETAHKAAQAERKDREAAQIAHHKNQMAQRRSKFEKKFRNVWATGATGISFIHMTSNINPEELVTDLFRDTMVADVIDTQNHIKRSVLKHGRVHWEDDRHRITMVTSDDRVAEAIETICKWHKDPIYEKIPFDTVVVPLATGSKDYIEWVKLQTLKKEDSTAFWNESAGKKMAADTSIVDEASVQKEHIDNLVKDIDYE